MRIVWATRAPCAATWSSTRRRCASSSGPGSMTTASVEPGSRSTQVLVPSRVIGPGVGRQHAVRAGRGLAPRPVLGDRWRGHRGSSVRITGPSGVWVSTGMTGATGGCSAMNAAALGAAAISSTLTTVGGSIMASPLW